MSSPEQKKKKKFSRPDNSRFFQQTLPSWKLIFTPWTVIPILTILGLIFGPIGGALFVASSKAKGLRLEYTNCMNAGSEYTDMSSHDIHINFLTHNNFSAQWRWNADNETCSLRFYVPETMKQPVFVYYHLTRFYQNHRRYAKSYDVDQLLGDARTAKEISKSDCTPLQLNEEGKPYYPCGLVANSMFNDTFSSLNHLSDETSTYGQKIGEYVLTTNGTAWPADKARYGTTQYSPSDVVPPPNWAKRYPNGYTSDNMPDLGNWEEFQVWMRTAALPTFSKLIVRNTTAALRTGLYEVNITYNFPTIPYGGSKSFEMTTTTAIGGKNYFLGILYIVIGCLFFLSGIAVGVASMLWPRRVGDPAYLSWKQDKTD
ncbi:CDC50 domain-containing protein [Schizosaccharomyces japonicus yFS275]|uniref:CDC50 domain-containing protein n=1 Tax=Schizosaccharomyces japonicus (strain yFS275 / FY16936) TaxID=402676 RepID=B6K368_SCHJY|nr:CDC50 domain-containing protein [Schizosaccharomyces japonicus yFS275]EEB07925.1 CDC50 domain-containing protein [Schizosaccharomyces japonicus yFS275]